MKKYFITIVLLLCISSGAIAAQGIKFEYSLTWAQIKQKAKREHKYIFVDIYTTWCVPCRKITTEIFPQEKVGAFFNENFISVAVQFDKTEKDSKEVKAWYKDVAALNEKYKIQVYPTYLFFNPQGELVHTINGGSSTADEFISKAKRSLDPKTQYETLKVQFNKGKRDPDFLLTFAKAAQQVNDEMFLKTVANAYLKTQSNLLTTDNLKWIELATTKSTDPGFRVLLHNSQELDKATAKGTSSNLFNTIAFDEVVLPLLRNGGTKTVYPGGMTMYGGELNKTPDWTLIKARLDSIYPTHANELILTSHITFFEWMEDWPKYIEAASTYVSSTKDISSDVLCTYALRIFRVSDDPKALQSALDWSATAFANGGANPQLYLYANSNLLYKLGKKEEAIALIEKAGAASAETKMNFAGLLNQIQKGEKTW